MKKVYVKAIIVIFISLPILLLLGFHLSDLMLVVSVAAAVCLVKKVYVKAIIVIFIIYPMYHFASGTGNFIGDLIGVGFFALLFDRIKAIVVGLNTRVQKLKLSKRLSKTESKNMDEAKQLRNNTNYRYTRKLTDFVSSLLTFVYGLSFLIGIICLGVWVYKEINRGYGSSDRDEFIVIGLALIILTSIMFIVSKLLLEMTNMMTDVADSNVKLVSQMKELIVMKNMSTSEVKATETKKPSEPAPEVKPTEVKKPSEPAPEVKPTETKKPSSEQKNISNFDSGAPPMV